MRSARVKAILFSLGSCVALQAQFLTTTLPNAHVAPGYIGSEDGAFIDLDGDGDLDAVARDQELGVLAYLNDGFHVYEFPVVLYNDAHILSSSYADLNADGLGDLVITSVIEDQEMLLVLLQEAPFSFVPTSIDSVADDPWWSRLQLFDADGDTDQDILWTGPSNVSKVYVNTGNGSFEPGMVLDGIASASARFGDVDGNGTVDIVGSYNAVDVKWFSGLGNGSFSAEEMLVASPNVLSDLQLADTDGDLDLDLLLCHPGSLQITRWVNDGSGGFTGPEAVVTGILELQEPILAVDLDGDQDLDILVSDDTDWLLCRNNGLGDFASPEALEGGAVFLDPTESVSACDVDLDGDMDLFPPWLYVAFNNGSAYMETEFKVTYEPPGERLFPADMDGDGDLDLATDHRDWLRNELGVLDAWVAVNDSLALGDGRVCDVDGDGDVDQVLKAGGDEIVILYNDGSGYFQAMHAGSWPMYGGLFEVGDLDQDGDPDILAVPTAGIVAWYSNNGSGSFTQESTITSGEAVTAIRVLDVNEDGLLDVCVAKANSVAICTGTGNGNFTSETITASNTGYLAIAMADVDGDGIPDLLGANEGIDLYRGIGLGGFLPADQVWPGSEVVAIDLMDGNADGLPDLFFSSGEVSGQPTIVGWFPNDLTTPFLDYDTLDAVTCFGCAQGSYAIFDIDGEGDEDVITSLGYQVMQLKLHRNQTGGSCQISGTVFVDLDQDGSQDGVDVGFPLALVVAEASTMAVLDPLGSFALAVDTGTFAVSCVPPEPWWALTTSPAEFTVQLDTPGSAMGGLNFGFHPTLDTLSVLSSFVSSPTRCGFQIHQWVNINNQGTIAPLHGYVRWIKDSQVEFLSSIPVTDSIVGDTLYWGIDDLDLFEQHTILLEVEMPDVSSLGDTIHGELTVVTADEGDANTATTITPWESLILCGYDPNDKQVEPVGFGEYGAIDIGTETVTYTIRFQNTGLDTAFTVVLADPLDALIDRSSLYVLASSHPLTAVEIDPMGLLTFRFDDIHLPPLSVDTLGSQGFVRFRLALANDPAEYAILQNTAQIYFDYNPPIITNTVSNTLVDCSTYSPTITQLQNGVLMASSGLSYQWLLNGLSIAGGNTDLYEPQSTGNYSVQVQSIYGCSGISESLVLGIDDHGTRRMLVYPNPTTHDLYVELPDVPSASAQLVLFDQLGRRCLVKNCGGLSRAVLNLNGIDGGIYTLRMTDMGVVIGGARVVVQ